MKVDLYEMRNGSHGKLLQRRNFLDTFKIINSINVSKGLTTPRTASIQRAYLMIRDYS